MAGRTIYVREPEESMKKGKNKSAIAIGPKHSRTWKNGGLVAPSANLS